MAIVNRQEAYNETVSDDAFSHVPLGTLLSTMSFSDFAAEVREVAATYRTHFEAGNFPPDEDDESEDAS